MSVPAEKMALLLAVAASSLRLLAVVKEEVERIEEVGIEEIEEIEARDEIEAELTPLFDGLRVSALVKIGREGEIFVSVGSVMVCNLAKLLLMLISPLALRLSLFPELRDVLVRVMLLLEFRERLLPEVIDPALTMFVALMVKSSLA